MQGIPTHYQQWSPQGLAPGEIITLSTTLILKAAAELGVEFEVIPGTKIIRLTHQGQAKYFRYQLSTETTDVGFAICDDKSMTNNLLRDHGLRIPPGFNLTRGNDRSYWKTAFESLEKPLIVKPTHGNQGNGITVGISTWEEFEPAVEKAFAFLNHKDAGVMAEQMVTGNEYRVLLTREKVLGVLYRRPASVVGNGQSSIQELIDAKNSDPRRGSDDTFALFKIVVDQEIQQCLNEQSLALNSVPTLGQQVYLRKISNIARGGDSIDVTDKVHPSLIEIALKAINAIPGIDFVGLDIMTHDIEAPQTENSYHIIEINTSPGFCIQEFPFEGQPRRAQYEFLYLAFPNLRPTVSV